MARSFKLSSQKNDGTKCVIDIEVYGRELRGVLGDLAQNYSFLLKLVGFKEDRVAFVCRLDLNDPPTEVGGIQGRHRVAFVCRLDLNINVPASYEVGNPSLTISSGSVEG
jgi:hypothetical protein